MLSNLFKCVIFCCCYISLISEISTYDFQIHEKSPVILVPGFFYSRLQAKRDKSSVVKRTCIKDTSTIINIWLNLKELLFHTDCWIDIMRLVYNNETGQVIDPEGVMSRVPGWGDPAVVENIDESGIFFGNYFTELTKMLIDDLDYVRNVSLRAAPYDFRKGPAENEEFFSKLRELVEETYEINNKLPVTLMAHSMGNLMSLTFLQRQSQSWKDNYINSLISLSAPWGGSVKALEEFAVGDNLGIPIGLDKTKIRKLMVSFPSLAFLSPSKLFWNDEVLVESSLRNYSVADFKDYFERLEVPNSWKFYENNQKYQLNFTPPGVEVHCLHGINLPTVEKLQYKSEVKLTDQPTLVFGDGDGTVNLRSLEGCKYWIGKQKEQIHHHTFPGVQHTKILQDNNLFQYIKKNLAAVDSTVTIDCVSVDCYSDDPDDAYGEIDLYGVEGLGDLDDPNY